MPQVAYATPRRPGGIWICHAVAYAGRRTPLSCDGWGPGASMGGVRGRAPPPRARRGPRPQPPGPRLPAPGRPRGRSTQRVRSCGTWREISEVNIGYSGDIVLPALPDLEKVEESALEPCPKAVTFMKSS